MAIAAQNPTFPLGPDSEQTVLSCALAAAIAAQFGGRVQARRLARCACAYVDRLESAKASANFGAQLASHDLDRK